MTAPLTCAAAIELDTRSKLRVGRSSGHQGKLPAGGGVRRQDPQRGEARRAAYRADDSFQAARQRRNGSRPWAYDFSIAAAARRSSYRVAASTTAITHARRPMR